jgi:hypothetical protein
LGLPLFLLHLTLLFRILQVTRGGVLQAHRPGNRGALCSLCAKWDCTDRAEAWSYWARPCYATCLIGACFDVQIYPEINTTLRIASYPGPQASHHTQMPQTDWPMIRYSFSLFVDVVLVPQLYFLFLYVGPLCIIFASLYLYICIFCYSIIACCIGCAFLYFHVMWTYKNTQQIQQTMIEEQKPHWYLDEKKYVARLLTTMFIILSSFHILCNRMEGRRNINVRHSRGMIRTKEKTVHGKQQKR